MINFVAVSYVLVLTIINNGGAITSEHIEGFSTIESCQIAGEKAKVLTKDVRYVDVRYVCLPKS